MANWALTHPNVPAASANNLIYGGAIDGIVVNDGPQKVYLVFYGSQWGTQGTNSNGYTTLSGDPSGEAPRTSRGSSRASARATSCGPRPDPVLRRGRDRGADLPASNTAHVAYPTGGALAGVWVDESAASP